MDGAVSLDEARRGWSETIRKKGGHCPCCDRWGKIYSRKFNATMARSLIWLVSQRQQPGSDGWCDVPRIAPLEILRTNQLPTCRWWDLCERRPTDDSKVKHSGWWRATDRGVEFATGRRAIPLEVLTYDGNVLDFGDEHVRIQDTFDTPFDYEQVMLPILSKEGQAEWAF